MLARTRPIRSVWKVDIPAMLPTESLILISANSISPCKKTPSANSISSQRYPSRRRTVLALLAMALVTCVCGCDSSENSNVVQPPPARPLRLMDSALRRGQLEEAWDYSSAVAAMHGDKPEVLTKIARLAHDTQRPKEAAEYLLQACRVEEFSNPKRVQQAMIGLVGIGRLYDGLDLLQSAVAKHPEQHESRRWLFDLLMGSEDRQAGLTHGRQLIRARQFDVELLKALSNTEYRTMDAQPLLQMTERNPDDKRPLLGDARQKFDERDYAGAIGILNSIVQSFPEFAPAQSLLGRALSSNGQWQEFESWASKVPNSINKYPYYWLALGDWARFKQQYTQAARCYWEATQVDADLLEAWTKLSLTLRQLQSSTPSDVQSNGPSSIDASLISKELLDEIDKRASLLSQFNQEKQKFERTGGVSRETAIQMAKTLIKLGRLWEAEAWSAIAMQLPEDDSVPAEEVRKEIVSRLSKDTPWQTVSEYPELKVDLTSLEIPSITRFIPERSTTETESGVVKSSTQKFDLRNEAVDRGLRFFGRTSERLDQPGIMLFETLGCGGGTLDYDLDGWSDLYLAAAGGTPPQRDSEPNALFRNQAGTFHLFSELANTADRGFAQGITVGDINEDGFPDILVLNYGPNTLLVNNGDGTFSDQTQLLSENPDEWSTSGAIADIDGDGLTDAIVLNYCSGMEPVTVTCPMPDSEVFRSCSPVKFKASLDRFYQTTNNGILEDVTNRWGGQPSVIGRGLGMIVGPINGQPGNDIFIANDMTNNHLWSLHPSEQSESEDPMLVESAMLRGLGTDDRAIAQGSMGIAAADLNRDGDLDFYVTNFDKEYNTLHDNKSADIWQDITSSVELAAPTMPLVGFGTEAVDLDSDGSMELIVANGHVDMFSRGNEKSLYQHPMQLFELKDDLAYRSMGEEIKSDYFLQSHVARALWTMDANGDAITDLVVTHQTEPTALLINHSPQISPMIHFELVGTQSSRDAIGARLRLSFGDEERTAWLLAGDGYLCSNERTLRVALAPDVKRCKVEVVWPNGEIQIFEGLEAHRKYLLIESANAAFAF